MQGWHWALLLKPFLLPLFLLPGAILAWYVKRRMPDNSVKRFLTISWRI